ncbi:dihydroneopterin aldolase [Xylanibacter muris]
MMEISSSYIFLSGVRFHSFHGVMPQERRVGADFTVDLRIGYDFSVAAVDDDLEHTISYADLFCILKDEMSIPSKLVEHVAGRISRRILSVYPEVNSIDIIITKDNPPMGADSKGAGVELHIKNV